MSTYWKIEITTLDPIDKITDEYWRLNSALGFELGRKNKFDIEEKAKQVWLYEYLGRPRMGFQDVVIYEKRTGYIKFSSFLKNG